MFSTESSHGHHSKHTSPYKSQGSTSVGDMSVDITLHALQNLLHWVEDSLSTHNVEVNKVLI